MMHKINRFRPPFCLLPSHSRSMSATISGDKILIETHELYQLLKE